MKRVSRGLPGAVRLSHSRRKLLRSGWAKPDRRRDQCEIDLVAYEGETLCFVEVKSRASDWFAPPEANVDRRKQRQIARARARLSPHV